MDENTTTQADDPAPAVIATMVIRNLRDTLITDDLIRQIAAEMAADRPSRHRHSFHMGSWGRQDEEGNTTACAWGSAVLYATGRLAEVGPTAEWIDASIWRNKVQRLLVQAGANTTVIGKLIVATQTDGLIDAKGMDFAESYLPYADLSHANLAGVNFSGSRMFQAHLDFANLTGTDFNSVTLRGADLTNANVCGANFYGTDLQNANLRNAICDKKTIFPHGFSPIMAGMKKENGKFIS